MPLGDDALVARVVTLGDQNAFATLMGRYQSQVRGYLRGLTCNPDSADELAQEAFIQAWDKLGTYAGGGRFAPWLIRIAHNQFLQAARKSRRYQNAVARAEHDAIAIGQRESRAPVSDELPDLPKYMQVLDNDEKSTMWLFYAAGLTHQEICDLHQVPLGTVKSRIHRGKEKIRKHFSIGDMAHG